VLWECFLDDRYRGGAPTDDTLHLVVWQAWERFWIDHAPGAERLVTTWEDIYDRETWQLFLESQGYRRVAPASFARTLAAR
jgi:hypothetical protein